MIKNRLGKFVGIIGAVASIVALLITLNSNNSATIILKNWANYSLNIPIYLFVILIVIIYILVKFSLSGSHAQSIPSDGHSVMQYMIKNKLIDKSTNLDLCHYTAETIIAPWRTILEEHNGIINIRMMVRRPETDDNKRKISEGCLDTIKEIYGINPKVNIDVRFYNNDPLIRYQMFYNKKKQKCIVGVYRYDSTHKMKFIGAEKNAMLVLNTKERRNKIIVESMHSRYQYLWGKMSALRAVVFDMDGVLVDSMRFHYMSWKEAFIREKVKFDEIEFRKDIYYLEGKPGSATVEELYHKYMKKYPTENLLQKIVDIKRTVFQKFIPQIKPFEGVKDVLDYLQSCDVPLAVVTGSNRKSAEMILNRCFPNIFNIVVSGSDLERGKPDALPFSTAVKKLNIDNPDQCLAIENAPLGVQSARSAKIPVYGLLLDSPLKPRHLEDCGALRVFHSHFKLLEGLKSIKFCELNR
jgi:beta-phosphoglucomutase